MRRKLITIIIGINLLIFLLFFLCSCNGQPYGDNPQFTNPPIFGPAWLDSMIEVAKAFSITNAASASVNPYAFPISVALAGVATMLEALRRKERSARKHAENKLNAPGQT